jgi:tetratricopeptide (TPR) repeat protein
MLDLSNCDIMEIKSIPEIIKEMDLLFKEEKYDEAYEFAKENINLNKEYIEGEYVFKNLLEELLFQITINKEIKRKYPLMLDYSTLYSNYGNVLLHFSDYENALKSFKLSYNYNPVNVNAIFGLCEIYLNNDNWDEYYKLTLQSFKYDYERENLAKSFMNLSSYYLNEYKESNDKENLKLAVYLNKLSEDYYGSGENRSAIEFNEDLLKEYDGLVIEDIKDYLKSKGLPYGPSVEVITICKNLGFQLDEDKKVVPALFYFNIAYDLTHDSAIKDVIDDLNQKVEKKLNE